MTTIHAVKNPPHVRRNFLLFLWDYIMFSVGVGFVSANTVIPNFVGQLTDNSTLIGLAGTMLTVGWLLPQLISASFLARTAHKKPWLVWPMLPARSIWGLMAIATLLIGGNNPGLLLVMFFVFYGFFSLGDGLTGVPWQDMLGTSIPPSLRGRLFGIGTGLSALLVGIIVAPLAKLIIDAGSMPSNYAILFTLAMLFTISGTIGLMGLREVPGHIDNNSPPLRDFLPYLRQLWREDPRYRRFIIVRILMDMATIAAPFYIGYGTNVLGLSDGEAVAESLLLLTLGSAVAAFVLGLIADRKGARLVIQIMGVAFIAQPLLALLTPVLGQTAWAMTFAMQGVANAGFGTGFLNWVVEHAPPGKRPIYAGLTGTISAVVFLAPVLGGAILDFSNYTVLFFVALALGIIGTVFSLGLAEPRNYNRSS